MANNKQQSLRGYLLLADQMRQMEESNEELKRQNSLKDRLLSIISHDARAPLSSLKSLLNLLEKKNLTQTEQNEVITNLNYQVEQLSWFFENLLLWTKENFSQIKPKTDKLALHLLVKETVRLLSFNAKKKRVAILTTVSEEIAICADGEMVKLVLRNLISNAIKFCNANDKVHIQASARKEVVIISVSDTGLGITEETLATLFNLSHITKGTKDEIGVGLGLSICKEFVEKMGGRISASSKEGKGSCFEFTVPRYSEVMVTTSANLVNS